MNLKELKRKQILTITTIALILISFTVIVASVLNIKAFANTGDDINAELNICQHTFGNWYVGSNKLHARDCTKCGATESDSHAASWGSWAENTISNRHERNCTVSSCTIKEDHAPVDTNNDGKCDTCGFTMGTSGGSTHTHSFTNNWVTKTDGDHYLCCDDSTCSSTSKSHSAVWGSWTENTISNKHERYCSVSNCTIRDWDNEHTPVDANNDGKCDICGLTVGTSGGSTHTHSFTNNWVTKTDGDHYLCCDDSTCSSTSKSHSAVWGSWTENTISNKHERYCSVSNCTIRDWDNEHTPVDANNDGKCDICGLTVGTSGGSTHTHTFTNKWVINADGKHYLMCDTAGCTQVKESHIASWTGNSCTANRICAICGISDGQTLGHNWQAATCTEPETCSRCQEMRGVALGHDWEIATCTKAKTCRRCQATEGTALGHDWQAATCTKPKTCGRCQATEGTALGHNWQAATCTEPAKCSRCQTTQGTALGHDFANWTDNNDGTHKGTCNRCQIEQFEGHTYDGTNKCTKCNAVKQNTTCEHEWKIDKTGATETQHWEKCTKCQEKRNIANHTFVNGKCNVCDYVCKHTNTTVKKDETNHWKECNNCGEQLDKKAHNYENGKCECGKEEGSTTCEHDWKIDKTGATETQHWEKCTKCQEKRNIAYHTFKNGICNVCGYTCKHTTTTVKSDETNHWKECNNCGEQLDKKAHSYENGKCECGKTKESGEEECIHTNREWRTNETEHWQVCKDCGKEIKGTRGNHVNINGKCKNCGATEKTTTSGKNLPNTGNIAKITSAVLIITVICGISYIGFRKYKDIK